MEKGEAPPYDICERSALFSDCCLEVALGLPGNTVCREVGKQLTRSGGSVGSNVEEAQATTTKSDFTYRMSVALREARETRFWLKRIRNNQLLDPERVRDLIQESDEMVAILTAIVKKARGQ